MLTALVQLRSVVRQEHLAETVHRAQRRTQVVRDRVHERLELLIRGPQLLGPLRDPLLELDIERADLLLGLLALAHVPHEQHELVLLPVGHADLDIEQMAVLRAVHGLEAVTVPFGAAANALDDLRFGHDRLDVRDSHPQQLLATVPAHSTVRVVDIQDARDGVVDQKPVARRCEDRLVLLGLPTGGLLGPPALKGSADHIRDRRQERDVIVREMTLAGCVRPEHPERALAPPDRDADAAAAPRDR